MKKIIPFVIVVIVLLIIVIVLSRVLQPKKVMTPSEKARSLVLGKVTEKIQSQLSSAANDFSEAVQDIAQYDLTSDSIRNILNEFTARHSFIVDCCIVDTNGIMTVVEPEHFKSFEGSDIHDQEQVQKIHQTHMPVMSKAFVAVEGFQAVDIEYPVINADGNFIGSLSMLIRPDSMLVKIIRPVIKGVPVNIWVMQKDGVILYDVNKKEIGRNIFTDEMYKPYGNLQALGFEIIETESGLGSYTFLSDTMTEPVEKQCFWETVELYNMQWKLVLTSILTGGEAPKGSKESIKYIQNNLRNFIQREDLHKALYENNEYKIKECFSDFYNEFPYIYSIQWTDTSMIGRFGIPEEHSLSGYDYRDNHEGLNERNAAFIKLVEEQQSTVVEKDLLEGESAMFIIEPAKYEDVYFGIIYVMILK